jgi:hypothetical protein
MITIPSMRGQKYGAQIGQRYHFTAEYRGGDWFSDGYGKAHPAGPDFDDPAQYTEFLKGDTSASRTIVASVKGDGKSYVDAIE